MADKRPGGLTALAVLNFIFGGLGLIASLGLLALLKAADSASNGGLDAALQDEGQISAGMIYFVILLSVLSAVLLITSGVGYLQQKKFLGRTLGNGYAVLSILSSVLGIVLLKQGVGIGTIIGLIYPVLTLALLNMTFKDDLVR